MKKQLLLTLLLFACFIGCSGDEVVEEMVEKEHVAKIISIICEDRHQNIVVAFDNIPRYVKVNMRSGQAQYPQLIPFSQSRRRVIIPKIKLDDPPYVFVVTWMSGEKVFYHPCP